MITKKSIEIWSSGKVKELYPNILETLDIDKIKYYPHMRGWSWIAYYWVRSCHVLPAHAGVIQVEIIEEF